MAVAKGGTHIDKHNKDVYLDLEVGDLVEFEREFYSHWAVFIGNGEVIHLAGEDGDGLGVKQKHVFTISGVSFDKAIVRIDKFWDVVAGCKINKGNKNDHKWKSFHPSDIVERAMSKLGRVGYNLIFSNCEHFANWCRYDQETSGQVQSYLTGLAVGAAATATLGLVAWLGGGSSEEKNKKGKQSEY